MMLKVCLPASEANLRHDMRFAWMLSKLIRLLCTRDPSNWHKETPLAVPTNTRYLPGPLTEKGPYFQKSGCENRTRAQKLSTRRAPLATSFSENRTPASKNRTLPMAGSCSRPAGLVAC